MKTKFNAGIVLEEWDDKFLVDDLDGKAKIFETEEALEYFKEAVNEKLFAGEY
jgi:hypothetical protein